MNHTLPDTHQNAWSLASIQLAGATSLPVLAASVLLLQQNNLATSLLTLLAANVLLFFIRLGIVYMSYGHRASTLDIAKDYVGNLGSYPIAILLIASTIAWYTAQTTLASNSLTNLIPLPEIPGINRFIQIAALLGIVSTLLCMEGIVVLKWLSLISFPILLLAFLGAIFTTPNPTLTDGPITLSFPGLGIVLGTNLGVTADLPTFFRHSASRRTSVYALLIIQVFSLLIGIGGLYIATILNPWFGISNAPLDAVHPLRTLLIILIFISVICANVVNVYSASVGWELVAPALAGRKEYLLLGLGLTTIFILVANIFSMNFLLNATDNGLVNLCLILLVGYVIRLLTKHPPSLFLQMTYLLAWLASTTLNTLQFFNVLLGNNSPLVIGFGVILAVVGIGLAVQKLPRLVLGGK
ncbi:MAG: hypothetical protein AB7M93_29985 [Candidatus Obscuribacterales bacterium]